MKQWKAEEWQGAGQRWHVGFTSSFTNGLSAWWLPARLFDLTLPDFCILLHDKYKADVEILKNDMLLYTWSDENYTHAHKFLLDVNKAARKKKIMY